MKKLLALLLALVMVFGLVACGGNDAPAATDAPAADAPAKDDAPAADAPAGDIIPADQMEDPNMYFTQFDEPIELHLPLAVGTDSIGTLEGDDTVEDNWFTRFILDTYNIKVVYDWTANGGDEYNQKLSMAISSDTLPTAWVCGSQYWKAAAKNGQLRELSADYEKYVCDEIKAAYEPVLDRVKNNCSVDGEWTCLTGMTVTTEGVSVLFINKNWLDQLGLEPPTNLAEVESVAKAFKAAGLGGDATIPIMGPGANELMYSPFYGSSNVYTGLDAVFAANDAYPGFFYTDESGEVVYGSLTQEVRDTLELLAGWYADGLIDPELGIRTDTWAPINANTAGMFFGSWWQIGFGNPGSFFNDPDADWRAYAVLNENGEWTTKIPDVTTSRLCISADATDEEALAAIIVFNSLYGERSNPINTGTTMDIGLYPLRAPISAENFVDTGYQHCLNILEGKEDKDLYMGDPLYNEVWQTARFLPEIIPEYTPGQELTRKDFVIAEDDANWQPAYSWLIGNKPYATTERAKEVQPEITYMTPAMEMYWTNLEATEKTVMLSIITGAQPITAFDDFVTQWYAEGGEEIMAEVKAEIG